MGEAAETASSGGAYTGDGGAGRARALRRRGREARSAAQHTAARRRVRARRKLAVTGPLSASRADAQQLPAAAQQVRERRAGVGGRGGGPQRRQEGRAAAEGHALVGAHGARRGARLPAGRAALRHGAAPRAAARRVTPRLYHITLTFHYRAGPRARPPPAAAQGYRLGIYCSLGSGAGPLVTCEWRSAECGDAETKTELKRYNAIKFTLKYVVLGKINSNRRN